MNAIKRFGSAMIVPVLMFAFRYCFGDSLHYLKIQPLWED